MRFTSTRSSLVSLVTVGALGATAFAQDSVSKIHGLPGDAVDPRAVSEQQNDYVVDQTIVRSSWGTVFGVAPITKTGIVRNTAPDFFNAVANAQYLSQTLKSGVPFVRNAYGEWSAQGFGVNDDAARNDPPSSTVNTTGLTGFQFAAGMAEFSNGTLNPNSALAALNNITGSMVNFTGTRPSRLFVSRIQAAVNGPIESCNMGSIHMGSIDSDGNIYFRGDNFGSVASCGGYGNLVANNLFRIRVLARNAGLVNVISGTGGDDVAATDWMLISSATTHNPPSNLPQSLTGTGLLLGSNFSNQFVRGPAGLTSDSTHLAAGVVAARGAVSTHPAGTSFLGAGSVATCGIIGKPTSASGDAASQMNIWGVDGAGNVTGSRALRLPPTLAVPVPIVDNAQPTWSTSNVPGPSEFDHYHSQTAFQGGNGQIAIGKDQQGNTICAAVVYYGLTFTTGTTIAAHLQERNNYIAVSRIDPTGTIEQWSVAGWTQETVTPLFSDGKTIFQNGTTPIGRLTGANFGPTMSAPMIDSVGNIWFVGQIELSGAPATQTSGLIRAVYDAASFTYKLELVMKVGDVFAGRNSATNYMVRFLDIADNDSVSSGTAYSGNMAPYAFLGQSTAGMQTTDSQTLGGVVVHASILYDVNNDGLFVRSVGTGGTPGSPDEDYDVLLYLSSATDVNANNVPDDAETAGVSFCGNGDPNRVPCPCGNNGTDPLAGCANSLNPAGCQITTSGLTSLDNVVLNSTGMTGSIAIFFRTLGPQNPTGLQFGDGITCTGGSLLRLRAVSFTGGLTGVASFPVPPETVTLSFRSGTAPGSGAVMQYGSFYRNASAAFCPPFTFNTSNTIEITW